MCLEVGLSRHIIFIDIQIYVHCLPYILQPLFYTVGLQYQATWRALCLGLRIRHVSRGEGEFFVPQNPLILRDHVPSSFWGPLPPVLRPACLRFWGPRTSGSYWGPSCLLSKARVPSVFEVLVPPLRVSYLQPKKSSQAQKSSNSNTYTYISNPIPLKTVEHCYSNTVTLTLLLLQLFIIV